MNYHKKKLQKTVVEESEKKIKNKIKNVHLVTTYSVKGLRLFSPIAVASSTNLAIWQRLFKFGNAGIRHLRPIDSQKLETVQASQMD